ncbi:MAG: hypothetical protein OHK0022_20370 [Roseiflexaceae bacterium]
MAAGPQHLAVDLADQRLGQRGRGYHHHSAGLDTERVMHQHLRQSGDSGISHNNPF